MTVKIVKTYMKHYNLLFRYLLAIIIIALAEFLYRGAYNTKIYK